MNMKSVNGVLMMSSSEIAVVAEKNLNMLSGTLKQCWNNWESIVQIWTMMIFKGFSFHIGITADVTLSMRFG